jgi:hypothetical protein
MASTYVNDLRLNEMATGDGSGTWGTTTNTNLELIAEAFSYGTEVITTNADTHTTTIADGATDPGRSLYLKYTGTLDSACTITIGPNTVSKVWIIENGTSGSQNIIISQGSGANITIPAGDTKVVYSDGAGAGAAFVDAFASLSVVDLKVQDDLTVTDDASIGGDATITGTLGVTGNITGTLATAAQPNITSVGTLTGLDVSGIGGTYQALNMRAGSGYAVLYGQTTSTTTNSAAMQVIGATSGASAGGGAEMLGVIQIAAESDSSTNATGYINFYTGSGGSVTEAMRIDSSGALLVGTTTSAGAGGVGLIGQFRAGYQGVLNGFGAENVSGLFYSGADSGGYTAINSDSANSPLYISLTSSATASSFITFSDSGANVGSIGVTGGSFAIGQSNTGLGFFNTDRIVFPATSVGAVQDNAIDLGYASGRFDDIYATNGTIQTSDRNEKQDIEALTDAETRVAVAAKGLLRKFRWQSAVEEKGDEARIHFGIIAQDLQDAFTAERLDAGDYAMFISRHLD